MVNLKLATISDRGWIYQLYSKNKGEIGAFNAFFAWSNYIKGERLEYSKFICYEQKGFVRCGYSKTLGAFLIHEIVVGEEFRREGIAAVLFTFVKQTAEAQGKKLTLKCHMTNAGANKFYSRMGMKISGESATGKGVKQFVWTT
jgi:GNAT superfamily N-acetyltransferase